MSGPEEARAPLQRRLTVKHTLLRAPLRRGGNGNICILEARCFALGGYNFKDNLFLYWKLKGQIFTEKRSDPEPAERFVSTVHGARERVLPGASACRTCSGGRRWVQCLLFCSLGQSPLLPGPYSGRQGEAHSMARLLAVPVTGQARGAHLPAAKANPEEGPGRGGVVVAAPAGSSQEACGR